MNGLALVFVDYPHFVVESYMVSYCYKLTIVHQMLLMNSSTSQGLQANRHHLLWPTCKVSR